MGIYPQPNSWLCGPFALKHALIAFGIFENEWTIARAAGSDPGGTDERELARGARQFGCSGRRIGVHYPEDAFGELVYHLREGMPTLLCIEQWDHWVTAMHFEDDRFVLFDSRGPHVIRVMTWDELRPKWEYRENTGELLYDLHPVVPPSRQEGPRALFSLTRARWLSEPQNAGLARQWSDYGKLVLSHGTSRRLESNHDMFARPMNEMLALRRDHFMDAVARRLGPAELRDTSQVLERLRFVAETYDLTVDVEREASLIEAVESFIHSRLRIARPVQ
jgi:hypothetical protein